MKPLKTDVAFATPWFEVLAKTFKTGEAPYYTLRLPDYASIVALTEERRVVIVRLSAGDDKMDFVCADGPGRFSAEQQAAKRIGLWLESLDRGRFDAGAADAMEPVAAGDEVAFDLVGNSILHVGDARVVGVEIMRFDLAGLIDRG